MLFRYKDKDVEFETNDRELGRLFLQRRLPTKSRSRVKKFRVGVRNWMATLPLIQWVLRFFGGDFPSGP